MNGLNDRHVGAGEAVYHEGGPGDAVFIVAEGKVEVLRQVGQDQVRLAVLGKGAIFGEAGVLRDRVRSTTVRALEPTTLMVIPKDSFLSVIQRDNPLALTLVRALCERLATAQNQLLTHLLYSEGAPRAEVGTIRLVSDSHEMQVQIGSDGLRIDNLPFRVGRHTQAGERTSIGRADLMFWAAHGEELSPLHFAIEVQDGRLIVRDLESHLGTLVNGRRIAHFEEFSVADLRFGATPIQAGGLESPYRFQVIVERAGD